MWICEGASYAKAFDAAVILRCRRKLSRLCDKEGPTAISTPGSCQSSVIFSVACHARPCLPPGSPIRKQNVHISTRKRPALPSQRGSSRLAQTDVGKFLSAKTTRTTAARHPPPPPSTQQQPHPRHKTTTAHAAVATTTTTTLPTYLLELCQVSGTVRDVVLELVEQNLA